MSFSILNMQESPQMVKNCLVSPSRRSKPLRFRRIQCQNHRVSDLQDWIPGQARNDEGVVVGFRGRQPLPACAASEAAGRRLLPAAICRHNVISTGGMLFVMTGLLLILPVALLPEIQWETTVVATRETSSTCMSRARGNTTCGTLT